MLKPDPNIERLIIAYFDGGLNEMEIRELQQWRSEKPENEAYFQEMALIWDVSENQKELNKINTQKAFDRVMDRAKKEKQVESRKSNPFFSPKNDFWKVAAVFLVILGIVKLTDKLFVPEETKIFEWKMVQTGANPKSLELPDGSVVNLRENSSLEYRSVFDDVREVKLSGEAFFEVERDESKKFIVEAQDMRVQVLGTAFMISAIPDDTSLSVLVSEGKVAFYHKGDEKKKDKQVILEKGQKANYDKLKKSIKTVLSKDMNELSWLTGKLSFNKTQLDTVIKTLQEFYGVNIVLENEEFANCKLSADFDNQKLKEVIEVIRITYDVEVEQEASTIRLIGKGC